MRKPTLEEKCQACKDGDIKQLQAWYAAGKLESLTRPPFSADPNKELRLEAIEQQATFLSQRLINIKQGYPTEYAIGFGQLEVLRWISTRYRVDRSLDYWAVICAIVYDQEEILQWLVEQQNLFITHSVTTRDILLGPDLLCDQLVMIAVKEAIRAKKLSVIQWLLQTWKTLFDPTEFDNRLSDIFLYAIQHGHLDLVKWIATRRGYTHVLSLCGVDGSDAFNYAVQRKQCDVLEWLILCSGIGGDHIVNMIKLVHSTTREDAEIAVMLKPIAELLEANIPLEKIRHYPKTVQMLRDQLLTAADIGRLQEAELMDLQNQNGKITKPNW